MSTHSNSSLSVARLYADAVSLLRQLIATPSFSREEQASARVLRQFMSRFGMQPQQNGNNVWARCRHFDPSKPTLLLNSHHDVVRPNEGYTREPFVPAIEDGKLFGLGSNDAGGCLVSLLAAFRYFYHQESLAYNLIFAASAEEEISGTGGITSLLPVLGSVDCAIVGEPTGMKMALAEKGLMVLDCTVAGVAGHAARTEGVNAIYEALPNLEWFRTYRFPKISPLLGACCMNVSVIQAGKLHNMIPAACQFTVDIRLNDCYSHEEILAIVREHTSCSIQPRSMKLHATCISESHPLVIAGSRLGKPCFGSATLSDKALMPFPALKMGPGLSERSHAADEFIYLSEIESGIADYIALLKQLL
ncbi:MAG: M20 family metallo-hydrolase [Bacteroidetes bacterium]|nr:M20 family metallo-hydrolase [Bacteroidota bacterium]MBS1628588.1 M20 family metallo-hydrolase [Bacteroidota bacterium]